MILGTLKLLLEYAYGKPPQALEVTGAEGGPLQFEEGINMADYSDDELTQLKSIAEAAMARRDRKPVQ